MTNELTHHGILGQRKGVKNGPPYPITDYSKYSAEERKQFKEKAIRQGNVKEAHKNRDYFTDQELKAVRDRFELNEKVKELSVQDIKSGEQKAKAITSKFNTAANLLGGIANLTGKGIDLYNKFGSIAAAADHRDFTPINFSNYTDYSKKKDNSQQQNNQNGKKNGRK